MHLLIFAAGLNPDAPNSLPPLQTLAVAAICGWAIPVLTDLITKAKAPTQLKTVIATLLSVIAGAATTTTWTRGERWQDYAYAIGVVVINSQAIHRILQGLGDPVQKATAGFGLGPVVDGDPGAVSTTPTGRPAEPNDSYFPTKPARRTRKDAGELDLLLVVVVVLLLALLGGFGFAWHALWIVAVIVVAGLIVAALAR